MFIYKYIDLIKVIYVYLYSMIILYAYTQLKWYSEANQHIISHSHHYIFVVRNFKPTLLAYFQYSIQYY